MALKQELLTLTAVHEALQHESAALSGGNANDIDTAIAAKNEIAAGAPSKMNRRPTGSVPEAVKADLQDLQDRLAALAAQYQNSTDGTAR